MRDYGSSSGGWTRRQFLAATGMAAATNLAGCAALTAFGDDFDIGMTAVAFDPPMATVEADDEVAWHNTSSRGHIVTAYEGTLPEGAAFFASGGYETEQAAHDAYSNSFNGLIGSGETYTYSLNVPGEYEYLCIPHEQAGVVDTIVVEE